MLVAAYAHTFHMDALVRAQQLARVESIDAMGEATNRDMGVPDYWVNDGRGGLEHVSVGGSEARGWHRA